MSPVKQASNRSTAWRNVALCAAAPIWIVAGGGAPASVTKNGPAPPSVQSPPQPPANGELAFVVNHFAPTYHQGKDDCPEGMASMLRANWLATLPPEERTRISQPQNAMEFNQRYRQYATGPNNTNICSQYYAFPRAPHKTVQGRVAPGFNLDGDESGKASGSTCAHANFVSPDGQTGVDNQLWRATGCLEKMRGVDGMPPSNYQQFDGSLSNGENAQVLVLRGVDSMIRDDDVDVIYTNTGDRAILDPKGKFIPGATFSMINDNRVRNVFKGRIVNGVLTATIPKLRLKSVQYTGATLQGSGLGGIRGTMNYSRVRLRLEFQADGSLKGMFGGYMTVSDAIKPLALGSTAAAVTADWDCPVMYATYKQMADADRDPKTGECTSISTAQELTAVPATVLASPPAVRTALNRQ